MPPTTTTTVLSGDNQAPVARFDVECRRMGCRFDAAASSDPDGTVADHRWTFGDGAIGSGVQLRHNYGSPGTYTATLTVTDDAGASSSTSRTLTCVGSPALCS